ncbi:hypothetical protein JNW90_30460 [Micromonospora sp. STR1s_5]|nr:hypothetical protein [Micromonospora sp. STR1s_5]
MLSSGIRIFVLTGAGVSAESGLGTFRDPAGIGIWARFDPMKLATPEAFAADPEAVHAFYNARRANLLAAEPNPAHYALARLEKGLAARGDELALVTQNIDDLHERAGSERVIHMHGELLKARCTSCGTVIACRDDLGTALPAPNASGPAGSVRTSSGSAKCPSTWMRSMTRSAGQTRSSRSAPQAQSTRPQAS